MSVAAAGSTAPVGSPRRRVLVILLIVSAALNIFFIAGAAWIHFHAPPFWRGMEERYRQMAADLDLDQKQRAEFDAYVAAMRARTGKMQRQVAPLMAEAWEEIAKPQADSAQVMRLFDSAAEKRREFQREATAKTFEFLAVLSPAQRTKFVAIARERHAPGLRVPPWQR